MVGFPFVDGPRVPPQITCERSVLVGQAGEALPHHSQICDVGIRFDIICGCPHMGKAPARALPAGNTVRPEHCPSRSRVVIVHSDGLPLL